MEKQIYVPDIGDFEDVEVVEVLVQEGDTVAEEDGLITLETDKAAMDVPAPAAGVIKKLVVAAGDRVSEGSLVGVIETAEAAASDEQEESAGPSTPGPVVAVQVPDIGDFEDVEVIEVLVSVDDIVAADDPLITLESDKAAMDVPAPGAGRIVEILVSAGDRVSQGSDIVRMEGPGDTEAPRPAGDAREAPKTVTETVRVPDIGDFEQVEVIEVMVSAGDSLNADDPLITLESDKAAMDVPAPQAGTVISVSVNAGDKVSEGDEVLLMEVVQAAPIPAAPSNDKPAAATTEPQPSTPSAPKPAPRKLPPIDEQTFSLAHASPSVRRFARELGVDLNQVDGSGHKKRILLDDVKSFVKSIMSGAAPVAAQSALPELPRVNFEKFGEIERQPLNRIQKISGPRLHAAWVNIPHVTQFDEADITELEAYRKANKESAAEQGARLTLLAFLVKACMQALIEFPKFNTSLDDKNDELVQKKYFNVGFAADTPNGLVVPVIKDVDKKGVLDVARDLADLSAKAREGKIKATDMQGGCFTISSLGGIGGTAFTPIINPPEVAILGLSRSYLKPVYDGSEFQPRLMLPMSLSYDHRVIDGAEAARFTTYLGKIIQEMQDLEL
ncbi:MAG: dihydrolipoyllysine-residue acetyltransferase [Pseudomonadota bacterium]